MAIRQLLTLARRSRNLTTPHSLRRLSSSSSAVAAASSSAPATGPPPPDAMIYDRLAEEVKQKIKRFENPDSRFLQYNSPHPTLADHTPILSFPATRVTTLPSGLRVATETNLAVKTATVGVFIDAGSRFETDETNGTAHFLEHMIFKGTEKRTSWEMEEEIENMGGHLNAYTSREQTAYYAKVLDKDVPVALDILADILQNSKFEEKKIERERDVILREMEERLRVVINEMKWLCIKLMLDLTEERTFQEAEERTPQNPKITPAVEGQTEEVIFDHLHSTAFQYSPLGRTILGPAQNIKTITRSHLKDYISTHYTAPRMVIVAAGPVKHEEFVDQVKKQFTRLSTDPTTASELVAREPAIFTGSEVRVIDDDIPLAQFAVAFQGAPWTDPDTIPLMVMQSMLGTWNKNAGGGKHMGSNLAQSVGINELAESMMAFNTNYKDTGLFGVYAVAKPDCLSDLSYCIMREMSKMCYRVSDADVTRACNQLKSSLMLHIDGTSPVAEDIGRQLLTYGRRIPVTELFARIDSVDASTIKRVANRFIFDQDVAISAVGPIQTLPDYNWFRRRTYMLRY